MFPLLPEAQPSSQQLWGLKNILQCFEELNHKEGKGGMEGTIDGMQDESVVLLLAYRKRKGSNNGEQI